MSQFTSRIVLSLMLSLGATGLTRTALAHEIIRDLEYESPGSLNNRLDLYTPDGGVNGDFPTLLYIHGGGWWTGDKDFHAPLHAMLADEGYSVVSCNYTLSTQRSPSYPQAIHDVKAVIRWIRTIGVEQFNLSPTIVVYGSSAGGHLAMILGTTAGVDFFEPLSPPPGGYAVSGSISFFGVSDLVDLGRNGFGEDWRIILFLGASFRDAPNLWAEASPIKYVDENDPPMALFHGRNDRTVPFSQSAIMQDAATGAGMMSWFFPFAGGHDLQDPDLGGYPGVVARMIQIIPAMLARDPAGNTPLTAGKVTTGKKLSGDLRSVMTSDNQFFTARSTGGNDLTAPQSFTVVINAEAGISSPQTIDVAVESKISQPAGLMRIMLRDVDADRVVTVGEFAVGLTEEVQTVRGLDASRFFDEDRDVELAVQYVVFVPFFRSTFDIMIDAIDLTAN